MKTQELGAEDFLSKNQMVKGIRVYEHINVDLTYQNFGSSWLFILRGSPVSIDLVFNGLYNLGATNGDYQFLDHCQTVAQFWGSQKSLLHFFFNQYYLPKTSGDEGNEESIKTAATLYAQKKVQELRENGHENLLNYGSQFSPETHTVGKIRAERPDVDFKGAVLAHAFTNKND
jgi:hypothetical protein